MRELLYFIKHRAAMSPPVPYLEHDPRHRVLDRCDGEPDAGAHARTGMRAGCGDERCSGRACRPSRSGARNGCAGLRQALGSYGLAGAATVQCAAADRGCPGALGGASDAAGPGAPHRRPITVPRAGPDMKKPAASCEERALHIKSGCGGPQPPRIDSVRAGLSGRPQSLAPNPSGMDRNGGATRRFKGCNRP